MAAKYFSALKFCLSGPLRHDNRAPPPSMDNPALLQHAALRLTSARDGETLARVYLELMRDIGGTLRVALYEAHTAVDVRSYSPGTGAISLDRVT